MKLQILLTSISSHQVINWPFTRFNIKITKYQNKTDLCSGLNQALF